MVSGDVSKDDVLPESKKPSLDHVPIGQLQVYVAKGKVPHEWSQELADQICALIVDGMSLRTICERPEMPAVITVLKWRRIHPNFAVQYASARADQADTFADEIMAIADDTRDDWKQDADGVWKPDFDHIKRATLRVDARKWIVAKLKPETYGDRVEARLTGKDGGAIQIDQRSVNISIDASKMPAEARDLLRGAVLGMIAPSPAPTDEEDS